jgi:cobalt-zinc-cadmium efflux system outer membrane protein
MRFLLTAGGVVAIALFANGSRAADVTITFSQALDRAAQVAPDIAVAKSREQVARAEVGIAGVRPNPSVNVGSSTQAAKLSLGVTVPLVILGQRGAAIDAAHADFLTTRVDTEATVTDVRAGAGHSFVALWRAQETAGEKARAAAVTRRLEGAVSGRVDLGAAANVDGLRAHAERLRADADALQASQLVGAAASDLARWLGVDQGAALHADGPPPLPTDPPTLADLRARIEASPAVRRERADAHASELRADRERALVRPALSVDLGLDAWDQTLCPGAGSCSNPPVNYRGALGVELPILSQRGPYIERELALATAARTRESAERVRLVAALAAAYRTFSAWGESARALAGGVVPAADAAAAATEESYALGRAPLVAVLDAEKARIDARLSLLDARAQQADAWIEVQHAIGAP